MTYQVANGSIPATVERFLQTRCRASIAGDRYEGYVLVTAGSWEMFDWPHDREPTLQEAIEAVMRG